MPSRTINGTINVILNNFADICLRNEKEAGGHLSLGDMLKETTV